MRRPDRVEGLPPLKRSDHYPILVVELLHPVRIGQVRPRDLIQTFGLRRVQRDFLSVEVSAKLVGRARAYDDGTDLTARQNPGQCNLSRRRVQFRSNVLQYAHDGIRLRGIDRRKIQLGSTPGFTAASLRVLTAQVPAREWAPHQKRNIIRLCHGRDLMLDVAARQRIVNLIADNASPVRVAVIPCARSRSPALKLQTPMCRTLPWLTRSSSARSVSSSGTSSSRSCN